MLVHHIRRLLRAFPAAARSALWDSSHPAGRQPAGLTCITYSLVSLHASIIKIARLFLYFFSKRGSIYPKLHTVYGFCYVLRFFKESGEKLSAIIIQVVVSEGGHWSLQRFSARRLAISRSGRYALPFLTPWWTRAGREGIHGVIPVNIVIHGVYSNGFYILFDLGCR